LFFSSRLTSCGVIDTSVRGSRSRHACPGNPDQKARSEKTLTDKLLLIFLSVSNVPCLQTIGSSGSDWSNAFYLSITFRVDASLFSEIQAIASSPSGWWA
jgi:hypothetical protein